MGEIKHTVMVSPVDDRLLTADQVADWLNVSIATVRQWTYQGKIPSIKLSRKAVRYSENAIKEFIKSKTFTERRNKVYTNLRRKRKMPQAFGATHNVNSIVSRAIKEVLN